jgi:cytochrome P450
MLEVGMTAEEIDFALLPSQDIEIPRFHRVMREAREAGRVQPVRFAGMPSWMVTHHDDVVDVLKDEVHFSSRALHEANSFPVMGRNVMGMEGEEHRVNKALVSGPFRREAVRRYIEPVLRPLCHQLIDGFAGRGEADLVAEFTKGFPLAVICRLLGLPVSDEANFQRYAMALIAFAFVPEEALDAAAKFNVYLGPLLEQRRAHPGDDLLSQLAVGELGDARLTDEEVMTFVRVIFATGTDTTYNAVGSLIHALLTHPETVEPVRQDASARAAAIEELVRWNGPVGVLPRICPADVDLLGQPVPAGSTVLVGLASANRDPAVFDRPDDFDIERDLSGHIAFGFGQHFCLGAWLARAEMDVAIEVLLERLPGLKLTEEPRFIGAVLRGPDRLPVTFDT